MNCLQFPLGSFLKIHFPWSKPGGFIAASMLARHVWCGNFTVTLGQRFSIPVLAPPRSAHFVCYSYRFRCLFYWNASALRSGHHTIFLHDSSSKRTYSIHSALKCARREFKLYIFTDVYDVTLVRAWRRCATQIHEWMFWSEVNFSGFPLLRE